MHNMEKCGRGKGRPQGCSLRSHRRRRLAPLPPPFSPAPMLRHVVYASLLHFGVETAGNKKAAANDCSPKLLPQSLFYPMPLPNNGVVRSALKKLSGLPSRLVQRPLACVETGFCPYDLISGEGAQPSGERQDFAGQKRKRRPSRHFPTLG